MSSIPPYPLPPNHQKGFARIAARWLAIFVFFLFSATGFSQDTNDFDEVAVLFSVPRIGNTEISTLIKNEEAYIPVKEIFDYLKIKNTVSASLDSLSGFFIDPKATYLIDKSHNRIAYQGKFVDLSPSDLIQTEIGLYLKSGVFCQVFGLDCQFSFRNLSFTLKTNIELPALREMQQEQMRKNLSQLKGEKKADTVLKRNFSFLHFGMADWSVTATQENRQPDCYRANLSLGATVAGGEAEMHFNYYSGQSFRLREQNYRWRYVNNDLSIVRQISAGRIATPTVSSLFAPVDGIQFTNTPTVYRKSFGHYRYTGTTEPEWIVELYINNVLVHYTKADASGFYVFDIPIVYGNSSIRLKFYGPWGEESTKEEELVIPFNFLPVHQLEYTINAGVVEDEGNSRFSRGSFSYGLSRRMTVGGGAEYLSSVMEGRPMPFTTASARIGNAFILTAEYIHGVRAKGTLNYRLPSALQIDFSYARYNKKQTAILYNYWEERKASLTLPIHLKKFSAFSRLTYNQFVLPKLRYSNVEWLLSAAVAGVSTNLKTYVQNSGGAKPVITSDLSLSFRLPYSIRFSPQAQYQYDRQGFKMLKVDAEKRISERGYLNLTYQNNPALHNSSFTVGLRFDLSFARTFFSARRGNGTMVITQSASGSLVYEAKAGYANLNNQGSVGKGGFIVSPFLDLNCNGRRDRKEPKVDGLNLRINGGRAERRSDSTLIITGLDTYTPYFIELDKSSFDNIAWQIRKATIRATVEPNRLRLIEVPVAVVGEASGMVYLKKDGQQKGLSRIIINFYDSSHKLVAHTLTERDGYFSFLGLAPGHYTAQIDTAQLHLLNLSATPQSLSFSMASSEEGTIADGFEFVLQPLFESGEQKAEEKQSRTKNSFPQNISTERRTTVADSLPPIIQHKKLPKREKTKGLVSPKAAGVKKQFSFSSQKNKNYRQNKAADVFDAPLQPVTFQGSALQTLQQFVGKELPGPIKKPLQKTSERYGKQRQVFDKKKPSQ